MRSSAGVSMPCSMSCLNYQRKSGWRSFAVVAGEDPAVRAEVESLLLAAHASVGFLDAPQHAVPDDTVRDAALGMRLGAWTLTRVIGRGGMGEVYEAMRADQDFEQKVAIKLLQREAAGQLERFQAERQILARLDHAGIARLYDGGITVDQRPYMVMEYVEGLSITEYCAQRLAGLEVGLDLFVQVCDAVAYAHRNLIVHRDLKPSNILVTAGGTVKLLDFGIAKLLDPLLARMTQVAVAPMTPICAAPEQLSGGPITTATDVYALGLLLFELLAGSHPWMTSGTLMIKTLRAVMQRAAPQASRSAEANPDAPLPARLLRGDLDAIIAKALRTEPAHRYATVESLKLDVERALRGEPVDAREGARLYYVGHILRRYRWAVAATAAIVISLAGGLSLAAWQAHRVAIERDNARRDASREEAVRYSLTRLFRTAISEQGAQPATAKTMIDSSAQRVLRDYHDQPQLAGQLAADPRGPVWRTRRCRRRRRIAGRIRGRGRPPHGSCNTGRCPPETRQHRIAARTRCPRRNAAGPGRFLLGNVQATVRRGATRGARRPGATSGTGARESRSGSRRDPRRDHRAHRAVRPQSPRDRDSL